MSNMITFAFVTFILAIIYVYHLVKLVENVASSQVDRTPVDGDMCEVEKARVLELGHQSGDRKNEIIIVLEYRDCHLLRGQVSWRRGRSSSGRVPPRNQVMVSAKYLLS